MPSKVFNNVEDHRVLDGGDFVEDVTSVTLPDISHPTTTISVAGLVGDIDMPDYTHVDAMSFSIAHNNGVNGEKLAVPGKHKIELRVARQSYNVKTGLLEHKSVKYRMEGFHVKTSKGSIERGNPYGSTDDYSCTRYEEELDGNVTVLIDTTAGKAQYNGVNYVDEVNALLD